jgi:hypothetical protein
MVIFCDPWTADKIQGAREDVDAPTTVVAMPFEQTESVRLWGERIKNCGLPENRNKPKDTHTFITMGWGKPGLMASVAKWNPFGSKHIGWIDLGIAHAISWEGKFPERLSCIADMSVYENSGDKMHFHILRCPENFPRTPDYYHNIRGLVAAGYMTGGCDAVLEFAKEFAEEVERVIAGGRASIDEDLMAALVDRHPEKYEYSYGNYGDILTNRHRLQTGFEYLLWMCKDAKFRNCLEFAERLNKMILEAQSNGWLHGSTADTFEIIGSAKAKPSGTNLLKLHMMVKNESRRIRETLESVKPWIDSWCILDTGSTDGTQDIIREIMQGVPGELYERPIVTYADTGIIDYAASRNLGMELAGEDSAFLLLLNGDDILRDGEALRRFAQGQALGSVQGYHMEIRGESGPGFVYPRLIRSAAKWRYSMPTHEIICGSTGVGGTVPGAWILKCNDPLEVRLARWAKDQIILERWLKERPDDHRGLFYLAQTHECLSCSDKPEDRQMHLQEAMRLYKRRSDLGGWTDEVYESCMRAANCGEQLGQPWSETQELMLQAFGHTPHRAEPLARIAQHWLAVNKPAVAYPFALRAADLPMPPPGALNPDPVLYQTEIPDLLSRAAYYIGQRKAGRRAARKAAMSRPDDIRLRRNFHFYAQTLRELIPECREIDLAKDWTLDPGWFFSTPSVCIEGDYRQAIVRTVNYRIKSDGSYDYDGTIRTRNHMVVLDKDMNPISRREILDKTPDPRTEFPVHGFEDCRLFRWGNSEWAICTVRDLTTEGWCEQALLEIADAGDHCEFRSLTPLRSDWTKNTHQKNWKPLHCATMTWLSCIYSTDPLCVLDIGCRAGMPVQARSEVKHSGKLLGSSQAIRLLGGPQMMALPADVRDSDIRQYGGWLWVDHEVSWNGSGRERVYAHRFVLADDKITRVVAKSDPFYFKQLGIEFCAGLATTGTVSSTNDELVLSYSVHDASSELAVVPLVDVLGLLHDPTNTAF